MTCASAPSGRSSSSLTRVSGPRGLPGRFPSRRGGDRRACGRAPSGPRVDVGDSEDGAFWTAFLRSLKARGLAGVKLVLADAHLGLGQAVKAVCIGARAQRCRVHFMRNVWPRSPKPNGPMVAALIRTIFAQPNAHAFRDQLDTVAAMLGRQFPKVQAMLEAAKAELLAFTAFPPGRWQKIWSTRWNA